MKHLLIITLTTLFYSFSYGQTVTELYNKKDFQELIKFEKISDKLSATELYMVGFAFFQTENDSKAIEFYDKAILKGLNNGAVHFYKGLSLRYLKNYDEALKEIEKSLQLEPTNQEFMNEKGMVFYSQSNYDKALEVFEEAKKLPNTFPEPYYWIARIYHEKQNFDKALTAYYETEKNLPKDNSNYLETLSAIGQLEYTFTKDYNKSAKAYEEAIELNKENYELYKEDMEFKAVSIAQFEWNGQMATIRKSLVDAKETLDITYKVFLLDKQGNKVERRFVVEKTIQFEKDGAKYLLCEQDKTTGGHITYPYGWTVDNIPVDDLEKAIKLVLDGKMIKGASSKSNNK